MFRIELSVTHFAITYPLADLSDSDLMHISALRRTYYARWAISYFCLTFAQVHIL